MRKRALRPRFYRKSRPAAAGRDAGRGCGTFRSRHDQSPRRTMPAGTVKRKPGLSAPAFIKRPVRTNAGRGNGRDRRINRRSRISGSRAGKPGLYVLRQAFGRAPTRPEARQGELHGVTMYRAVLRNTGPEAYRDAAGRGDQTSTQSLYSVPRKRAFSAERIS